MAERRMFTKKITESDAFLDMALSTQALYFHLSMGADDDGFINSPKKTSRMIGAGDDELKILLAKKFVIGFESGIIVIKHWKMHNYIQKDRYKTTTHYDEMALLQTKENNAYTLDTDCVQDGRLGKVRLELGKVRLDEAKEIIEHLNQVCKTNFKHTSKKTQDLIKARINEGFTLEDFKHVHLVKASQWLKDANMVKFLRPETLYSNKFEGYRNEKIDSRVQANLVMEHSGMSASEMRDQMLRGES